MKVSTQGVRLPGLVLGYPHPVIKQNTSNEIFLVNYCLSLITLYQLVIQLHVRHHWCIINI